MTKKNKELTAKEAKEIVKKAREKDAQDCLGIINEALEKYRCYMIGTITLVLGGTAIQIMADSNKNLVYEIATLQE